MARMTLYRTGEHACGYFPERSARDLVLDPRDPAVAAAYPQALAQGFRRSGGHVYRPNCAACNACVPVRLDVRQFRPDRSQRRCLRDNADVVEHMTLPLRTAESFALYRRYLAARHGDGPMADTDEDDFDRFVASPWSPTRFLELRIGARLLAVAVCDTTPEAVSAVYTFFDPDDAARSPGTLAILRQIAWAQRTGRQYLYLGYWIDAHPKMHYKSRFQPLQTFDGERWQEG
ncbi:MAG: arginyltransferase [Proteobacteria bacterium]|nr:arginyltransferase [Pseudomonadota bacterium]